MLGNVDKVYCLCRPQSLKAFKNCHAMPWHANSDPILGNSLIGLHLSTSVQPHSTLPSLLNLHLLLFQYFVNNIRKNPIVFIQQGFLEVHQQHVGTSDCSQAVGPNDQLHFRISSRKCKTVSLCLLNITIHTWFPPSHHQPGRDTWVTESSSGRCPSGTQGNQENSYHISMLHFSLKQMVPPESSVSETVNIFWKRYTRFYRATANLLATGPIAVFSLLAPLGFLPGGVELKVVAFGIESQMRQLHRSFTPVAMWHWRRVPPTTDFLDRLSHNPKSYCKWKQ